MIEDIKKQLGITTAREFVAIRVALPKNLRLSGKVFRSEDIKYFAIGRSVANNKGKLGDQGCMLLEDYEKKDFASYGLKEYFDNVGKIQTVALVAKENTQLQNTVMDKDVEIAALKAQLAASLSALEAKEVKTKKEK